MKQLIKKGNLKIDKSVGIFNLPTSVCGNVCKGCYARKAEVRFPKVAQARQAYFEASQLDSFVDEMIEQISKSKVKTFRIHESGDFYSTLYVRKWYAIASALPEVKFYGYSKKFNLYNVDELNILANVNIINSMVNGRYNFGSVEYCNDLVEKEGFVLCPCVKGVKVSCGTDCKLCHDHQKVCFIIH